MKRTTLSMLVSVRGQCSAAFLVIAGSIGSGVALAQTSDKFTVSGSVEAGAEYNSNVSVSELESASGESDVAGNLEAGIDANWQATDRLSVDTGYSYSGQRYQDVDTFDLDLHLLYGDVSYEFDAFSLGSNYYYADANLGGDDFLTLKQYSFYAGKLFAEQWFLRAALNFADKSFDDFAQRDADTEGLSLDAFWFFNQGRSSIVLGYAFDEEQTRDPAFSYDADTLRLRYSQRFELIGKDTELRLGTRWQDRNYQAVTPGLGARRDDRQHITEAALEMSLTENLATTVQLERGDFQSNLGSADYTENRASVSVKLSF